MEKTDIKSLNLEELTAFVESLGEKKFRAKQIYDWIPCTLRRYVLNKALAAFFVKFRIT